MMSVYRGVFLAGAVLALGIAIPPSQVPAQDGKGGEAVKITTIDGVELHGTFYPGEKPKSPTIIMLHAIGDSAVNKKDYISLAQALQPNYAVMLFDFRGHGKSKDVTPEFWKYKLNFAGIKGANPKKMTIEFNELDKSYYPVLINDIAAVKGFLDRRNDDKECNTSSTILIGAETGATLGAIWLNSQWHLTRMIPNPNGPFLPPQASPNPEGKDVIACIWLSPTSKLGGSNTVSLTRTLDVPVKMNGCSTVFMYGDKDDAGKTVCEALFSKLTVKDNPKFKFVVTYPVKNTKLTGIALTRKTLGTDTAISDYLDSVVEKKANEWTKRDFKTSQYSWRMGPGGLIPAKNPQFNMDNLSFDDYNKFIGR